MYKVINVTDISIENYEDFPSKEFENIEQVKEYLFKNQEKNFHVSHSSWGCAYIGTRFWFDEDAQYFGKTRYNDVTDLLDFLDNLNAVN